MAGEEDGKEGQEPEFGKLYLNVLTMTDSDVRGMLEELKVMTRDYPDILKLVLSVIEKLEPYLEPQSKAEPEQAS